MQLSIPVPELPLANHIAFLKCEINCLQKIGIIISFQFTRHVISIKTLRVNYA